MGLFKMRLVRSLSLALFFFSHIVSLAEANTPVSPGTAKILLFMQQGQHQKAIEAYREFSKVHHTQDFDLLHRIGLGMLDYGYRQSDAEVQLLTLFGASISARDEVFYILEGSLRSRHPQIQLVAIHGLAKFHNDRADQALTRAMSLSFLPIRVEAAHQLCLKQHPQALAQTESLMYKTPKVLLPIYPQLFVLIENEEGTRVLRRLFNHAEEDVRIATILSAAKHQRDDLLPQIRIQASHLQFAQQEACAYALGVLKDEKSIARLQKLAKSQYPTVALAACQALYRLGRKEEARPFIESRAKQADVFAITILKDMPESVETLLELSKHSDRQVRINATLSLLEQRHPACLSGLAEILIHDKYDLAFEELASPGHALKAWKIVPSASAVLKDDLASYIQTLKLKEEILEKAQDLPEQHFLLIANLILKTQQNELIPTLMDLLEELETPAVVNLIKHYQQTPGAPFIRQYCNLSLYRLKEPGPYQEQLIQWVKSQNQKDLIRFRPLVPYEYEFRSSYAELTPEETSRLLIEAFEAFAMHQDDKGIEVLLDAIQSGNPKNKYALAGLLLRATQ